MPEHEFGIMQNPPKKRKNYRRYEPKKYDCITVNDEALMSASDKISDVKSYWGSLNKAEFGLDYFGVTLIPPESLRVFITVIADDTNLTVNYLYWKKRKKKTSMSFISEIESHILLNQNL